MSAKVRSCLIYIMCGIVLLVVLAVAKGPRLGSTRVAVKSLRRSGDSVISAIEQYRADHGKLPNDLDDIVPQYLPRLEKVVYCYHKSYSWPYKLFDGPEKTEWEYKTSYDGKSFALGVKANPRAYFDSTTSEWKFMDTKGGFANFDKP